mgnify:CR=1 FL=1
MDEGAQWEAIPDDWHRLETVRDRLVGIVVLTSWN